MKEIRIPIPLALLAIIGLAIAAVAAQLPEIRRYINIERM